MGGEGGHDCLPLRFVSSRVGGANMMLESNWIRLWGGEEQQKQWQSKGYLFIRYVYHWCALKGAHTRIDVDSHAVFCDYCIAFWWASHDFFFFKKKISDDVINLCILLFLFFFVCGMQWSAATRRATDLHREEDGHSHRRCRVLPAEEMLTLRPVLATSTPTDRCRATRQRPLPPLRQLQLQPDRLNWPAG